LLSEWNTYDFMGRTRREASRTPQGSLTQSGNELGVLNSYVIFKGRAIQTATGCIMVFTIFNCPEENRLKNYKNNNAAPHVSL